MKLKMVKQIKTNLLLCVIGSLGATIILLTLISITNINNFFLNIENIPYIFLFFFILTFSFTSLFSILIKVAEQGGRWN